MKLLGLCIVLVATTLVEARSRTLAKNLTRHDDDKFREPDFTTGNPGERLEERASALAIFGQFAETLAEQIEAGGKSEEGRTFGLRRLQFIFLPLMYKMGVMMTLMLVLTFISLKSLGIGVLLLVLKLSGFLAKLYSHGQAPAQSWAAPPQPIHVHVHNGGGHHHHPVHSGWESPSGYSDDEHYIYKG